MNYVFSTVTYICANCALHNSREHRSYYSLWNAIHMYATCGSYDYILFCYYFLIEVELIHNVMLVSGIQQSDLMI